MKRISAISILLFLSVLLVGESHAQARSVYWERWDAVINAIDTANNHFNVRYEYDVYFSGSFSFGSIVVEDNRLDSISNVAVYEAGQLMSQSCSERPGTYCVQQVQEGISIVYHFFRPIQDARQQFTISYTVNGALRIYEGGDQLYWSVIPQEHFGFPIRNSTVTVEMPQGYAPRPGIDPVETYGAPADVSVDGQFIRATATQQVQGDQMFEIRVQYPHNPDARPPAWQAAYDDQRAFQENVQPFITLGSILLSLLLGIGIPLGVFSYWYRRGRDPEVGPVPEYLTEPPSDLPPAVVGTLIDEKADVRDVLSIFIDLARRGYLVIEENKTEGIVFGLGARSEFTFKRTDKSDSDLASFERMMFDKIFTGGKMERDLDDLKNKFYTTIPKVQNELYNSLYRRKLVTGKPSTVRSTWSSIGTGILIGAAVIGFLMFDGIDRFGGAILCIPAAVGFGGLFALSFANFMPAKTQKGALEAAKWRAFQKYLQNLEKYDDVESASVLFEKYLPYAVAFGYDRAWVNKFKSNPRVGIPIWYYPTYRGGYYGRGYRAGTPVGAGLPRASDVNPGDLARAGGGNALDDFSGGLAGGLDSISDSLTTMLDSASRTFTSAPSSSGSSGRWSGGGSSWSGGGSFGGGSSGGGSSGFG